MIGHPVEIINKEFCKELYLTMVDESIEWTKQCSKGRQVKNFKATRIVDKETFESCLDDFSVAVVKPVVEEVMDLLGKSRSIKFIDLSSAGENEAVVAFQNMCTKTTLVKQTDSHAALKFEVSILRQKGGSTDD